MYLEGDGPEGQPSEGVTTLDGLVGLMDGGEEGAETQEEAEEGDESAESEEVEESEEQEETEEEQEEPTVTLKHDGKEVTLKQSEVVDLAQQGFDYTQKTMKLAEERKALDATRGEVAQQRKDYEALHSHYKTNLETLGRVIEAELGTPPPITLAQQDAAQYLAQKELYDRRKDKLNQVRAELDALEQDAHRQRQAEFAQKVQSAEQALKDTLPGWSDAKAQELFDYLGKQGLNFESLGFGIAEKGLFEMAHKAQAYDQLVEKRAQMKPVKNLPKVAAPQAKNQPAQLARRQEAMKRHKANPSMSTLADLII